MWNVKMFHLIYIRICHKNSCSCAKCLSIFHEPLYQIPWTKKYIVNYSRISSSNSRVTHNTYASEISKNPAPNVSRFPRATGIAESPEGNRMYRQKSSSNFKHTLRAVYLNTEKFFNDNLFEYFRATCTLCFILLFLPAYFSTLDQPCVSLHVLHTLAGPSLSLSLSLSVCMLTRARRFCVQTKGTAGVCAPDSHPPPASPPPASAWHMIFHIATVHRLRTYARTGAKTRAYRRGSAASHGTGEKRNVCHTK